MSCASAPKPPRPPKYPNRVELKPPPPEPVVEAEPELPAPEPVEPLRAGLLDSGELIVGGAQALEAWQRDGSHRVISPGPALHPRRYGRDHVVVVRPLAGNNLRDGVLLELIALANGERRELARVPGFRCAAQGPAERVVPRGLDVEAFADFEVHAKQRVVCLGLMDAAADRASVRVRARVDLATQRIERWLALGEDTCKPPADVQTGDPAPDGSCWGFATPQISVLDRDAFRFTFGEEYVRVRAAVGGGRKLHLPGYQLEANSPSGRWQLLAGEFTERDTAYRRLLLLDRNNGELFGLAHRPGSWRPPLSAAGSKLKKPVKQAQLIPSDADVRWLGAGDAELLLFDALVIPPRGMAFELEGGEVAR